MEHAENKFIYIKKSPPTTSKWRHLREGFLTLLFFLILFVGQFFGTIINAKGGSVYLSPSLSEKQYVGHIFPQEPCVRQVKEDFLEEETLMIE